MSGDNEREIRDRLGGALATITPPSPPVDSVMQRGRAIRMRRRIGVAAGLAVMIAAAVALPGVFRQPARPVPAQHSYDVTVSPPPRGAPPGEIATGTINGKPWRLRLRFVDRKITAVGPDRMSFQPNGSPQGEPALLDEGTGGGLAVLTGPVREDVTHVTMRMSGGSVLDLRPVAWHGRRWVAVEFPQRLRVLRFTAYSRHGELAYAIPFGSSLIDWLKPGQRGPARATYTIGSGAVGGHRWVAHAYAGPWGLCMSGSNITQCTEQGLASPFGPRRLAEQQACGGFQNAGFAFGATALRVGSLRLQFSDGSTVLVRPVAVGGFRAFAYTIAHGLRLAGWTAFGTSGQQLGTGTGKGWWCNGQG